jgi:hypothetical protein
MRGSQGRLHICEGALREQESASFIYSAVVRTSFPCCTPLVAVSPAGHLRDFSGFAAQDQQFQAPAVAEVNMHRCNGTIQAIVLAVGEFFFEFSLMMIADQGERANSFRVIRG